MKPRAFVVPFVMSFSAYAPATPPPAEPPPVSAEVRTAVETLVADLPVEDAISRASIPEILSASVAEQMLGPAGLRPHLRCNRTAVIGWLAQRLAPRLPALMPNVVREYREGLRYELEHSMTVAELTAARALLHEPAGRALMVVTWGTSLRGNAYVGLLFSNEMRSESEALIESAVADCRSAHGRPPYRLQ